MVKNAIFLLCLGLSNGAVIEGNQLFKRSPLMLVRALKNDLLSRLTRLVHGDLDVCQNYIDGLL